MVVLPQFDVQWHQYEGQPDAVMRMRVAEELRRLDAAGAPLITCVLTIPDDRIQQVALERLRENDDGEGAPVYEPREWRLRIVKDGVAPPTDAQGRPVTDAKGRPLGPDMVGKVLMAKVATLGNQLGTEADAREVMRWGGQSRQNMDHTGRDLYRHVRVAKQWTTMSSFDDAVAVLRQWGIGVARKQYRRPSSWQPGARAEGNGQLVWLVEEWNPRSEEQSTEPATPPSAASRTKAS